MRNKAEPRRRGDRHAVPHLESPPLVDDRAYERAPSPTMAKGSFTEQSNSPSTRSDRGPEYRSAPTAGLSSGPRSGSSSLAPDGGRELHRSIRTQRTHRHPDSPTITRAPTTTPPNRSQSARPRTPRPHRTGNRDTLLGPADLERGRPRGRHISSRSVLAAGDTALRCCPRRIGYSGERGAVAVQELGGQSVRFTRTPSPGPTRSARWRPSRYPAAASRERVVSRAPGRRDRPGSALAGCRLANG
jgi:hypothetical protein